jgi:hypothetical protein
VYYYLHSYQRVFFSCFSFESTQAAELERDGHARLVAAQQQLAAQQRLRQELQVPLIIFS